MKKPGGSFLCSKQKTLYPRDCLGAKVCLCGQTERRVYGWRKYQDNVIHHQIGNLSVDIKNI